jgi:ribosomal RNA-processing protein 36
MEIGDLLAARAATSKGKSVRRARPAASASNEAAPGSRDKAAPSEISSKRKVPEGLPGLQIAAVKTRDPRFDESLGASLDARTFRGRYGFLIDDVLAKDIENVSKALKKSRNEEAKARLKVKLSQMKQQKSEADTRLAEAEAATAIRRRQRDTAAAGGRVYFPKRREMRDLAVQERFKMLRKQGGDRAVDRVIRKKRERNASKDRRRLGPGRRELKAVTAAAAAAASASGPGADHRHPPAPWASKRSKAAE